MFSITIGAESYYDEKNDRFVENGGTTIQLEHSLASLSKWESIHEKPFLSEGDKTEEEILSYVQCMIITPDIPPELLKNLTQKQFDAIGDYINSKQTATWFGPEPSSRKKEILTAEVLYYWMFSAQIPLECERWHLNKLLTLLRVFNSKNGTQQKMSRSEIMAQRRALNEKRRAELGSKG